MRQLAPCSSCGRHVFQSDAPCPFCRYVAPAALIVALALGGCSSDAPREEPTTMKTASSDAQRELDRRRAEASAKVKEIQDQIDRAASQVQMYGMPPPTASASTKAPAGPCKCHPEDPLCDCDDIKGRR